jgi:protein-S-isoprenylcysteine O-methyltransferase Ste14
MGPFFAPLGVRLAARMSLALRSRMSQSCAPLMCPTRYAGYMLPEMVARCSSPHFCFSCRAGYTGPSMHEAMTTTTKLVWVAFALYWGGIRFRYARRARCNRQVEEQDRIYESLLLILSFVGYLAVPVVYLGTNWLSFADYPVQPVLFGAGIVANAASLWLFWRSHADLGRNFSTKLVIREHHALVTTGVYALIRHPMYASFLLWSLGQASLLPNWATALAGAFGFGVLYFGRVRCEESLMLRTFGAAYQEYMTRTKRLVPHVY